ncbi:tyrosine-protein phosphatase non-receptor type 12-like [Xenia sp. Carnegie-2017]|uniref:tyrosine-protein phosphatase non-receptor type 12-like n=1 Tax=Xenia sp. Carnegie-2017 TaxID=2897299 RepID=UPI001F03777D|nr:tyrosine-protein phosphatase non-receptor type 12-like [Xenia sp. Carnegie-2017]
MNDEVEEQFHRFEERIRTLSELDKNGVSGFAREFQKLRQMSSQYKEQGNPVYATKHGQLPANKVKNRFKDILPFDNSRVTLPSSGEEGSDYINANFIKGLKGDREYIASQGPLSHTVNDFWRMVWTYKVKVVVMLCKEEESKKKKCQRYWCESDEPTITFGAIVVKTERTINVQNNFVMRTLLAKCGEESLKLTQFHYTAWPDHGVPKTTLPLIELIKMVRDCRRDNCPIVLHCSAGCGRTGTICAMDYSHSLLEAKRYKEVDPYLIVESLRKQRHAMVQTAGQYEFLGHAMLSMFREKLNLPADIDDDHLYVNVESKSLSSDSESEPSSPLPPSKQTKTPQSPPSNENKIQKMPSGTQIGPPSPAPRQKVVRNASLSKTYVNVNRAKTLPPNANQNSSILEHASRKPERHSLPAFVIDHNPSSFYQNAPDKNPRSQVSNKPSQYENVQVPEPYSARSASTTAKQMAHLRSNSYDQGDRTYHVLENPTNSSVGSGKSLQQMLDRAKVLPNNVSSSDVNAKDLRTTASTLRTLVPSLWVLLINHQSLPNHEMR